MSIWVFDVDGVVIDSKPLVFRAYEEAGCPMPEENFGVHWSKWMPEALGSREAAQAAHRRKTAIYREYLKTEKLPLLPGYTMASCLMKDHHGVYFVTSMAEVVAEQIIESLGFPLQKLAGAALIGPDERTAVLRTIKRLNPWETDFIYVDDRAEGAAIAGGANYMFTRALWSNA